MELRDELFALRDATAQSWSHAEDLKARWAELDKAQANLYQVSSHSLCPNMDRRINAIRCTQNHRLPVATPPFIPAPPPQTFPHIAGRDIRETSQCVRRRSP